MGGGASKQIAYGSHEGSSSAATTAPVSNQSVIRLINFELFKTLGSLPHYPEKRKLCSNIEKIDTKNSLFVFISYCWQRSWPGSEGYINHPHPDTTNDDIYKLCVEGIEKVKNSLAPGMKHCYVWVDYGCLDLEKPHYSSPSSLSSSTPPMPPSSPLPLPWSSEVVATMDRVMRASDLLFTPVFDAENRGLLGSSFQDIYTEYLAPGWKAEKVGYLSRAWCRLELLYASYIPLDRHYDRLQHFKAGLRHLYAHGKRAHVLYGSKESADHLPPIVLSPLYLSMTLPSSLVHLFLSALPASLTCSSSPSPPPLILSSSPSNSPTYDEFDPLKGFLTHEVDRLIILDLIHHLTRYIQKEKVGYTGERNARGQRDGRGKCILPSGDVFVGDFKEGRIHGTGKMTYKNGSIYEGEYARGNMEGTGKFTSPGGHVYVGQWKRGQMNGQGVFTSPSGDRYEGEFVDNQKWGKGKFIYASGSVYEGQFIEDTIEGLGRLIYTNGDTYDGEWRAGRKHGKGKVFHAKSGVVEEGMWADGQRVPYCP